MSLELSCNFIRIKQTKINQPSVYHLYLCRMCHTVSLCVPRAYVCPSS